MSDLVYSADALNVLSKFHRVDFIVHVEGDEDVLFWDIVFSEFSAKKFKFLPAGSCTALDKIIERIENGELDAVAARDSDYLVLTNRSSSNKKVVFTYGHSIENTIHHLESIHEICRLSCKTADSLKKDCEEWLRNFCIEFMPLLFLELASQMENKGISVLGDNCSKYMLNESSEKPSAQHIKKQCDKLSRSFKKETIQQVNALVDDEKFEPARWLRGHFFASGVQKFISNKSKKFGRRGSLPHESLFSQAILCLKSSLRNHGEQYAYYAKEISRVIAG